MIGRAETDEMKALLAKFGREHWSANGDRVEAPPGSPWSRTPTVVVEAHGHPPDYTADDIARFLVLAREMLRHLLVIP